MYCFFVLCIFCFLFSNALILICYSFLYCWSSYSTLKEMMYDYWYSLFFQNASVIFIGSCACKRSFKLKSLKSTPNKSFSLPQKTLLLRRLISSPTFNSLTSWHHTTSPCHTFACVSWPIRGDWVDLKETTRFRQRGNTELQHWELTELKCFLGTKACKPSLVATKNKTLNLKMSIMCLLLYWLQKQKKWELIDLKNSQIISGQLKVMVKSKNLEVCVLKK